MKQLNLSGKKKIILAVVAAIMVMAVMVLAIGSLNKSKVSADSNLNLVRSGNTNISKTEKRKQRLVVAVDTIDGILSPVTAAASGDQAACSVMFEPLAKKNPDGSFENILAKKVEWDKDTLTMTIELKKDILFSDGSQMTAADVCASIGAHCLTTYNLDTTGPYFNIKGVWDMNEQKTQGIEGIKRVDDFTAAIVFTQADAKNWDILETPIQKNDFAAIDDGFSGFSALENISKNAIGTGAYSLDSVSAGLMIVLKENANYRESVKDIKQIEFAKINFYDMQETLDEQNVDVVSYTANSEQYDMLYDASKYDVYTRPDDSIYMLGFNMNNVFLREKTIRQAISYALKREDIVTKEWKKRFEESNTIGYGTKEEEALSTVAGSYNKEEAVKLLKEVGLKDTLTFRFPVQEKNDFQKEAAAAIKKNLDAIGIQVEIIEYSDEEYVQALYVEDNFDLYLFSEPVTYDWDSLYAFTTLRNGMPVACTDSEYTDAVEALSEAGDAESYQTALKAAADQFYEVVPAIPIARAKRYVSVSADLYGFRADVGELMIAGVHEITSKAKEVK